MIADTMHSQPVVLLDDVMSELDFDRQRAVMEIVIKKQIQTFITGTGLDFTFKISATILSSTSRKAPSPNRNDQSANVGLVFCCC